MQAASSELGLGKESNPFLHLGKSQFWCRSTPPPAPRFPSASPSIQSEISWSNQKERGWAGKRRSGMFCLLCPVHLVPPGQQSSVLALAKRSETERLEGGVWWQLPRGYIWSKGSWLLTTNMHSDLQSPPPPPTLVYLEV